MRTNQTENTFWRKRRNRIIALCLLATSLSWSIPQAFGAGPAGPAIGASGRWAIGRFIPSLQEIRYGVAGNFVYDAAQNAWTWTTPNTRGGTIEVSPSLIVDFSSRETVHWYDNQEVGGSSGTAINEDREFSRYDITIQQVTWDSDAEEFVVDHSHSYHGGSFQTSWSPYMTAQKDSNGWFSGGWHLVRGEAEKSSVIHAIESSANVGDFTLRDIGDPGYRATVHFTRADMRYQGGGNWIYQADMTLYRIPKNLSAVRDDRAIVDLVDPNTKLTNKHVRGGSRLRWIIKSVPVTVEIQRQTYTFDQDNLRIPGPIEVDRIETNAPVWDIEQNVSN